MEGKVDARVAIIRRKMVAVDKKAEGEMKSVPRGAQNPPD